jgi:hypothetical protein
VQPASISLKPGGSAAFDLKLSMAPKKSSAGPVDFVIGQSVDALVKLVPTVTRDVLAEIAKRVFAPDESNILEPEPSCEVSAPSSVASAILEPSAETGISLAGRSVLADSGARPGATARIVPKTDRNIPSTPGDVVVVSSSPTPTRTGTPSTPTPTPTLPPTLTPTPTRTAVSLTPTPTPTPTPMRTPSANDCLARYNTCLTQPACNPPSSLIQQGQCVNACIAAYIACLP